MPCKVVPAEEAKRLEVSRLFGKVNEMAHLSQAITSPVSKNLTAGYLRLSPGYQKEITSPVDEIDLFIEGSLILTCEGNTTTAQQGDILFIERGSKVGFTTKDGCLVFYVTYPPLQETVDALAKEMERK